MKDLKCLAELLYLVSFYKRHNQTDVAIPILQNFIKQFGKEACRLKDKRVLALSLYNLAELLTDEGDRLIARELYNRAVDLWNEIDPDNRSSTLWYQGACQRLQEETDRLILWGGRIAKEDRRYLDIA